MLIDSATSSLADDNGSIVLGGTIEGSDMDGDNENEHNVDDEDDGYSLVSHASSSNMNLEGVTPSIKTLLSTDLFEKSIMIDESNVSGTSTTYEPEPNDESTPLKVSENETVDDYDSGTEFAVVDHTLNISTEAKETRNSRDTVVGHSHTASPPKIEKSFLEGIGMMVFVVILAIIVKDVVSGLIGVSRTNSRLQNEINLYKQELDIQYMQVLRLTNDIHQLEDDALAIQEQHKSEIEMWQQRIHEMQIMIESRPDQKEVVQKLEEQVHQLLEEASAMEVTSSQEIRRYQRGYREVQKEHKRCNEIVAYQAQRLDELSHSAEQCTTRKRQFKKEVNQIKAELQAVKNKLRTETKELKGTSKEVKRQKKVILKLQKQLADMELKKAEARKEKKKRSSKEGTKFHTTDEYTSSFSWDNGTTSNTAEKSILVDNCWMYLQAKMDFGECLYDMTDHVKDHFQTLGQTMSHSFQNAMNHLRNEMEQYHNQHQQYHHH